MTNDNQPNLSGLRVLVVEDDAFTQAQIVRTVKKLGVADVAAVADGFQALLRLEAPDQHPDVMLLDHNMPEMGGAELMGRLSSVGYTGGVVLVSGAAEVTLVVAEGIGRHSDVNVLGTIQKPVTGPALEEMLGKLWT